MKLRLIWDQCLKPWNKLRFMKNWISTSQTPSIHFWNLVLLTDFFWRFFNLSGSGKDLFNNIGQYLSSAIGNEDKLTIATNLRELFNLTTSTPLPKTPKRFRPKIIPVDKPETTSKPTPRPMPTVFTFPYTTPHFTTSTPVPEVTSTYDPRPRFRYTTTTEPQIIKFVKTTKPTTTTEDTTTEDGEKLLECGGMSSKTILE